MHGFHTPDQRVFQGPFLPLGVIELGWMGVDLFFVLSGFLLGGILMDEKGTHGYLRRFYIRRAARILPLYYLWLASYTILEALRPGRGFSASGNIGIGYHLLFLQNFVIAKHPGWLDVSWSLAVEEQFYLILPWLIAWLSRRGLLRLLIGYLALVPVLRLALLATLHLSSGLPLMVSTPTHGDGLALGVLLAIAVRSERGRSWYIRHREAVLLFIAVLGLVVARSLWGKDVATPVVTYFFLPIAILCGWIVFDSVVMPDGLMGRLMKIGALRFLGRISYCVYLVHGSALAVFSRIMFKPVGSAAEYFAYTVPVACVAVAVTLIIATLSMKIFEGPILKWAHTRQQSPRATANTALASPVSEFNSALDLR